MTPDRQALLTNLIDTLCDGTIDPANTERLEAEMLHDREAQWFYLRRLNLFGNLVWNCETQSEWQAVARLRGMGLVEPPADKEEAEGDIPSSSFTPPSSPIPPIVIDPLPTLHSPIGSFVFSHIAAAVILGIGMLIGLAWRISLPSSEGTPQRTSIAQVVGHISALADCQGRQWAVGSGQWADIPKTQGQRPKTIFLGDRFHLASGLMQITYSTGAQVILQGPCTYEIDATDGGYLTVGKLTAKVEKKAEVFNPQSPIPNPLFAVRTPTAVVTDLGTEFGVEVEKSGTTRSHVFQGSVEVRSSMNLKRKDSREPVHILHAGESVRVEHGRNNNVIIIREPGCVGHYIRRITTSDIRLPSSAVHSSSSLYRLTDLGALGGTRSRALAMNAAGHVVGEAMTIDGTMHAFLYADGKMKYMNVFHGVNSCAYGINDFDHVIGEANKPDGVRRAFVYRNGKTEGLGTLGGNTARALGINNSGMVVGSSQNASGVVRAYLHTEGTGMKDLGALGGPDTVSCAVGVNDSGVVMGYSDTPNGHTHPFLYRSGTGMKDLGSLNGSHRSIGFGINAAGQVVGCFVAGDESRHAFLYSADTGMVDIGSFGSNVNQALAINAAGNIVGYANVDGVNHAFLYRHGKMMDLNSLVAPGIGWILRNALAINDSGQIAGYGIAPDGNARAFLLTPVNKKGVRD